MIYMAHVIACAFCFVGRIERAAGGATWIDANEFAQLFSVEIYLRGFYWTVYSICTVGYGDVAVVTDYERLFAMCVMVTATHSLCDVM